VKQAFGTWKSDEHDAFTNYSAACTAADGTIFVAGYDELVPPGPFVHSRASDGSWEDRDPAGRFMMDLWAADRDHAFGLTSDGLQKLVGSTWTLIPVPGMDYPQAMTGFDANNAVVIGDSTANWFDGSQWTSNAISFDRYSVGDVWGPSKDQLFVGSGDGKIREWDGNSWTLMHDFHDAVEAISGTLTTDMWVATGNQIYHFNGIEWSSGILRPTRGPWRDILSIGVDEAMVVGDAGHIAHVAGEEALFETVPPGPELNVIIGMPGTPLIAAGYQGAFLRLER
jgi:hypothetical protein